MGSNNDQRVFIVVEQPINIIYCVLRSYLKNEAFKNNPQNSITENISHRFSKENHSH